MISTALQMILDFRFMILDPKKSQIINLKSQITFGVF